VSKLGDVVGKRVGVVGQGQNGLLFSRVLSNLGARQVIALDLLDHRLAVSLGSMRATHAVKVGGHDPLDLARAKAEVLALTEGQGCDVAVDAVGHNAATLDLAASLARPDGTVVVFGLPPAAGSPPMGLRMGDFTRNLRFVCSHSPPMARFAHAVEMLQRGDVDAAPLFTHQVPFDRPRPESGGKGQHLSGQARAAVSAVVGFPEAFDMASSYSDGVIKTLVTFD
jgi:threonine dehydrogenase-like Zn-dependent dehydrogenase